MSEETQNKIGIVMGGYLNEKGSLMKRPELDKAIAEIQKENARMKAMLYGIYKDTLDTSSNTFFREVEELMPDRFVTNLREN